MAAPVKAISDVLPALSAAAPAVMESTQSRMLAVAAASGTPDAPLKNHRVQISVRGRRFETSIDVATSYCLTFYLFFGLPVQSGSASNKPRYVDDLVQSQPKEEAAVTEALSNDEDAVCAVLLTHYTETVLPALKTLEAALTKPADEAGAVPPERSVSTLPPIPQPERIDYDAPTRQWRFNFPKKLTDEVEARERARLQRLAILAQQSLVAQGVGAMAAGSLDPNGSPFLLLQADYIGALLVFLRRADKARQEAAAVKSPEFPVRWHELGYDEQVTLTQTLRAFGVVPLLLTPLATPSADPETTSLYRSSHPEQVVAHGAMEDAAAGGSLRARAEQFLEEVAPQMAAAEEVDAQAYVHPSITDDLLTLPTQGCSKCGMSGHSTADCPY